jgi:hypothetical protein
MLFFYIDAPAGTFPQVKILNKASGKPQAAKKWGIGGGVGLCRWLVVGANILLKQTCTEVNG